MSERETSVEAAKRFGVNRTTTQRAAANGLVHDARQVQRSGSIQPVWDAPSSSWDKWHSGPRKVGRPPNPEYRVLDENWAAEIGPFRPQGVGRGVEWAHQIRIIRGHGTDDAETWATGYALGQSQYDPHAKNKGGGLGAYYDAPPDEEKIQAMVAELHQQAQESWTAAQRMIWVIRSDDRDQRIMAVVRAPGHFTATVNADQCGTWIWPPQGMEVTVEPLREVCLGMFPPVDRAADDMHRFNDLVDAAGRTVDIRCRREENAAGEGLVNHGFVHYLTQAQTYTQFARLLLAGLTWAQGETDDRPAGIDDPEEYRTKMWGRNRPYPWPL